MSDLFWLMEALMERLTPFFPLSHGKPRVDDRPVPRGIIFIDRNCLRWRDASSAYGSPKALYNRCVRWSRLGVFARILTELAAAGRERDTLMIDATHRKAHRKAASLRGKKGGANASSGEARAG
jgi:transposase